MTIYRSYCQSIEFGFLSLKGHGSNVSDCTFDDMIDSLDWPGYGLMSGYEAMAMDLDPNDDYSEAKFLWNFVNDKINRHRLTRKAPPNTSAVNLFPLSLYGIISAYGLYDPYHPDTNLDAITRTEGTGGPDKPRGIVCRLQLDGTWKDSVGFVLGYVVNQPSGDVVYPWRVDDSDENSPYYAVWMTYDCPSAPTARYGVPSSAATGRNLPRPPRAAPGSQPTVAPLPTTVPPVPAGPRPVVAPPATPSATPAPSPKPKPAS